MYLYISWNDIQCTFNKSRTLYLTSRNWYNCKNQYANLDNSNTAMQIPFMWLNRIEQGWLWDKVAEWLRHWTANPMGSSHMGLNPILIGSFPVHLTSSSSNQMQNPWDMHCRRFQFICRKLSTRKSGIWNNWEFLNQSKKLLNGLIVLSSWKRRFHWIPATLILQDIQYRKSYGFALTQGT